MPARDRRGGGLLSVLEKAAPPAATSAPCSPPPGACAADGGLRPLRPASARARCADRQRTAHILLRGTPTTRPTPVNYGGSKPHPPSPPPPQRLPHGTASPVAGLCGGAIAGRLGAAGPAAAASLEPAAARQSVSGGLAGHWQLP